MAREAQRIQQALFEQAAQTAHFAFVDFTNEDDDY
jgi:hypothetical protein